MINSLFRVYLFVFVLCSVINLNGAIITVTTTVDKVPGSLREAITIANTNGEDNVIFLPAGRYIITGDSEEDCNLSGDLDINTVGKLYIIGNLTETSIIDGNQLDRVYHILAGEVFLWNLTITNGLPPSGWGYHSGEPEGGGIHNSGRLTLENCLITGNASGARGVSLDDGVRGAHGGGIFNKGVLFIYRSTIENNQTADGFCGGILEAIGGNGAGIYNDGEMILISSTIRNNTTGSANGMGYGGDGGGIANSGEMLAEYCTISGNRTGDGHGGGWDFTFNGAGDGGGVYVFGGNAALLHCTISGNRTGEPVGFTTDESGCGGGLAVEKGDVTLKNCTVCNNYTGDSDYPFLDYGPGEGGGVYTNWGKVYLQNTILADNWVGKNGKGPDGHGKIESNNHNLIENLDEITLIGNTDANLCGVDPHLDSLKDNGGATMTHALLASSPAIDAGYTDYAADQRLFDRTNAGNSADIGAYEYGSTCSYDVNCDTQVLLFRANTTGVGSQDQLFLVTTQEAKMGWEVQWNESSNLFSVTPSSGTGSTQLVASANTEGLEVGSYLLEVKVQPSYYYGGFYQNRHLLALIQVIINNTTTVPFGSFDTPITNSVVSGSIPVSGWALDDIGVQSLQIFIERGKSQVYIGDAVFVAGARPDIEQAYPEYPNNYKAGWGYMMLTNFLPNGGNGTFNIHAIATDMEGHQVTLGTKTIVCDNANAVKPFGAIDTPAQGGTASGSDYVNFGWALTPLPNTIPIDGSTMQVWVDGVSLGNPIYNQFREDIATLFPNYSNSNGAVGYFHLDTTLYENGVHTIAWSAADDAGNVDGIGSRYVSILNSETTAASKKAAVFNVQRSMFNLNPGRIPVNDSLPVWIKKGFNPNAKPVVVYPNDEGIITIEIKELERLEIHLFEPTLNVEPRTLSISGLPIGSILDRERGIFYWHPGVGFLGKYWLLFIEKKPGEAFLKRNIKVSIAPKFLNNRNKK